jgi:hypothetical protein
MTHLSEVYMASYRLLRRQAAVAALSAVEGREWVDLTVKTTQLCLESYREAIETFEETDAESNRMAYVQCMWSLTIVYDDHGLAAEQEPWLKRVLCGYEALLGKEHPLSAMARQDLVVCVLQPLLRMNEAAAVERGADPIEMGSHAGRGSAWDHALAACLDAARHTAMSD